MQLLNLDPEAPTGICHHRWERKEKRKKVQSTFLCLQTVYFRAFSCDCVFGNSTNRPQCNIFDSFTSDCHVKVLVIMHVYPRLHCFCMCSWCLSFVVSMVCCNKPVRLPSEDTIGLCPSLSRPNRHPVGKSPPQDNRHAGQTCNSRDD